MSKLIWCSDIHLNFLDENSRIQFYKELKDAEGDIIVISGDIAESHNVVFLLGELHAYVYPKKEYFVLGNHDFYGSSVKNVRKSVKNLYPKHLFNGPVELSASTILMGVDAWGDCRNGDFDNSRLVMNDWIYIEDVRPAYQSGRNELKSKLQQLADADARKLRRMLNKAVKQYKNIIIVTHVPPFAEACYNAGRKSTDDGLPFFSSKCLGDLARNVANKYPEINFTWLSGHTHSGVIFHPLKNLKVKVAEAAYYAPQIAEVIEYE